MNYQEALRYITELQENKGSDYSLDPVRKLCELAGNPHRKLSVIHIAGTNGKGSIGSYLGNILAMSGYTVGRYVSPVLLEYRERIQKIQPVRQGTAAGSLSETGSDLSFRTETAAEYISQNEVAEILTQLRVLSGQMEAQGWDVPTAFEMETVMAFLVMERWKVDVALIECGMGGRTDATNIIESPLVCLFSHIGLDHTAFLGETVEKIALEKAGILKQGSIAVSVKQDRPVEQVLQKACQDKAIPLYLADPSEAGQIQYDMRETVFCYQGSVFRMRQQGTCQVENAIAAVRAAYVLQKLGYERICEDTVRNAVSCSCWRGRFECIQEDPYVIVDGAHNPQAAVELRHSLDAYFPGEQMSYICGFFRDKDYAGILDVMLPLAKRIFTVKPPGKRGLSAEMLAQTVRQWDVDVPQVFQAGQESQTGAEALFGKELSVQACRSVSEALDLAQKNTERILVFGSLSFLHEVYEYFGSGNIQTTECNMAR